MKFVTTLSLALVVYSSVLFSVTVTSSLTNSDFQLEHWAANKNDSNQVIDKRIGHIDFTNSSTFVGEGKASIIIHPKKQFWVEQLARKLAPFFSVISFWNEKCWTAGYDQGTCYSRKECISKGGTPNGMCAAGFGVCCVFSYSCDSATAFNRTYFLNPEFPDTIHEFGICPHSILKLEDICQIRIDFEVLELARPNKHGYCEEDMFSIHGTDFHMPPLCGDLTGHHLYLPVGYDPKITMQISLLSGNPWGRWKILTTKIKCSSNMLAPPGCQQHLYGEVGRITSFNYFEGEESNMNNLNYGVCVRKERGFCAIQWSLCNHGHRKRRSVKYPGETPLDVQMKADVTSPSFNEISITNSVKTARTKDRGFSISRSYAGIHVSRPKPPRSRDDVLCQKNGGVRNSSLLEFISCPSEIQIPSEQLSPPSETWRPFVPQTNYYVEREPQNPVKLERRTLGEEIGSDKSHVWTNNPSKLYYRAEENEPINLNQGSSSSGLKNPNPELPIRKYVHREEPLRAAGSESTFMSYSNPIPNGNQLPHLRDNPYLKSRKDSHYGIAEKVVGIKIPFYTKSKPISASASAGAQAQIDVNPPQLQPTGGSGHWGHKPIFSKPVQNVPGFTPPILNKPPSSTGGTGAGYFPHVHLKPKPGLPGGTGYIPPIQVNHKPVGLPGGGGVPPIQVKPKPTFTGGAFGVPPVQVKPKPTFTGGAFGVPPIAVKPKPTFTGGAIGVPPIVVKPKPILGGGASLFAPGKIKVKPKPNKPLVNNGFGLFGRPKVKPKPVLQYKPFGLKNKDKNKGNCTSKPKLIFVPIPIPLPIPIPIPIVPVVVVPFPFGGGGGGGGGGHGHDHEHGEKHDKVISVTEPYLIRIVTDDERDEGLSSFCMDWEQIPCDIWWTHHPKFPDHNEI